MSILPDRVNYVSSEIVGGAAPRGNRILKKDGNFELWREFGYSDYRSRLG